MGWKCLDVSVFFKWEASLDILVSCTIKALVSCTIKALVSCTSSVCCNSGSRLGGCFPVSVTAHVLCISSCLVPAHVQI